MHTPQLATAFADLFDGLHRAYGTYRAQPPEEVEQGKKNQGKALTVKGEVTEFLWQQHLDGAQRLGIIPVTDNATAKFGAIDIDKYDIDLFDLEARVNRLGLPLTLCRSKSGGAHLYLFTSEHVDADLIRSKLAVWATILGYPGVEVFPKQSKLASKEDTGNWINMPYFDAELSTTHAISQGAAVDVETFVELAIGRCVNEEQLRAVEVSLPNLPDGAPPCLQVLAANGVPEGSRNNALFAFGVLARLSNEDNPDENAWQEDVERFNNEFFTPPLPFREVAALVKSIQGKEYFYPCKNEPLCSHCSKSACKRAKYGIGGDGGDIGLTVDRVTKILTEPPTWIFCIAGVNIEMDTDDFLVQNRFKRKVAEHLNRIPRSMKQPKWEEFMNSLLQAAEEEEAPEDASSLGQFLTHLYDFCNRQSRGDTEESLLTNGLYHNEEEERIYFRSTNYQKYLEQQKFYDYNKKQVWAALRKIEGIRHGQSNIKGRNVQWWSIPEANLTRGDYEIPTMPQEEF